MEIKAKSAKPVSAVRKKRAAGFSIVEVLCAIAVTTVGALGLLSMVTYSVSTMQFTQEELIAKQKARETLEAIYSARTTQQLEFDDIQNTPSGVFLTGLQPLLTAGTDGLVGTNDDGPNLDYLLTPGPSGTLADGTPRYLTEFKRQIEITPVLRTDNSVDANIRQITVTIQYSTGQLGVRSYKVGGFISRYR